MIRITEFVISYITYIIVSYINVSYYILFLFFYNTDIKVLFKQNCYSIKKIINPTRFCYHFKKFFILLLHRTLSINF